MADQYAWLDRIIAEQAAYYGQTVEQFSRASRTMAELQEMAEREGWEGAVTDELGAP